MNIIQKTKKYSTVIDIIKFVLLVVASGWLIMRGSSRVGYNWQWYQVPQYLFTFEDGVFISGPLLDGLLVTLEITAYSLVLASVIGLLTALLRLSGSLVGRSIARVYLEVIRNTPLLVQIFFLYFVLAPIFGLERFAAAVVALSLFEGAYASEIFRAGIVSIHRGQWEAAYSLGLSSFDTYRTVILPQALKRILPPLTGQAVSLIKDSALVSTIAVYDLTMQGRTIIAETFLTFEIWFTVAAVYLAITLSLSLVVSLLEKRSRQQVRYV
jgi:polar amino acid transport system permease protein